MSKKVNVAHLVYASSSSVYGDSPELPKREDHIGNPISPYAATKKSGEIICHPASHLDGLAIACLRFFTVYGPRQRPDLAIHKFSRILREGGEIPMFGDGSTSRDYTFIDDTVAGVLGALEWVRGGDGSYGIVEPRIKQLPMQPGDVVRTFADIARARGELGYRPETEFREGVRRFLEWFDGQPA